jgi:hypothetical protein
VGKRIYLAGKIAPGDWRHDVVSGLRSAVTDDADEPWSTLRSAVLNRFDYVGPFFISCDHRGLHGPNTHGVGANQVAGAEECCGTAGLDASIVVQRCMDAIEKADVFYAWLDNPTAFGTIAEIGYASGRARQHIFPIFVATPTDCPHERDFWFALQMHGVRHIRSTGPAAGLREALAILNWT